MLRVSRLPVVLWVIALVLCGPSMAMAEVFYFQGVSTLEQFGPQPPVYGVAGEQVTVTFNLNTNDFYKLTVANPVFDYFEPNKTVPVHVVGSVSGVFPNVSPIGRVLALELTATQQYDLIAIDNVGGSMYDSFCQRSTCFDGTIRPNTPLEMFDFLERSIVDTNRWRLSTANPTIGLNNGSSSIILNRNMAWTVSRTPPTPYTQIDIVADADGQYTVQTGALDTTGASALVGVDSMQRQALLEFPLAAIPANATIEMAQLELRGFVSSGEPSLEIRGYLGNGALSLADVSAVSSVMATTGPVSLGTGLLFDLDASYIESLLGISSHLGVQMRGLDAIDYVGFYTREANLAPAPTLIIRYRVAPLAGDYNGNGVVDAADYVVWRNTLGQSGTGLSADGDGDGSVDPDDFGVWRTHFGQIVGNGAGGGTAANAAVPEPAVGLMLFVIGSAAIFARQRSCLCRSR